MKKIVVLLSLLISCTGKQANTINDDTTPVNQQKPVAEQLQALPSNDNDSTIYVHFPQDSIAASVAGALKKNKAVNVYVDVQSGRVLMAELKAITPKLNARINQLITPKGIEDGPFGDKLEHAVGDKGMYKIIIGSNLMAEGLTTGKFELRVTVK